MAGIPESVIDEVRERADIVEVIGDAVRLKKRGKNWVGLCPFHPEKTPSFNVTPEKQMYYCFGCQAGGNVFTFLMEHDKLEFPAAVRALAERYGVEVPAPGAGEGSDPNDPLYHANRLAAEFYHGLLLDSGEGAPARAYLERRGLERETWETFLLGWAPDRWEALHEEAARQGLDPEELLRAGLAARSEKTGGVYDRFRGRLVFPIRSTSGKVVAFSGRRLDDREPKYLNSTDTPVFVKGRTLFNLDLARAAIRRAGAAILVEGNFDVVALWQAGFRNVVAPLGTAFGSEQARLLKRYTATAYLAFDGDAAGERSAFRTGDVLLAAGFAVRLVSLPEGQDPDSLIREGGPEEFEARIGESEDVVEAKITIVKERVDLGDVMKKRRAIRRLMDSVSRVPDPMTRSLYTDRVAAELHVPRETLEADRGRPTGGRTERRPEGRRAAGKGRREREIELPERESDEAYVLYHALYDEEWRARALETCSEECFTSERYRAFFAALREAGGSGADDPIGWLQRSDRRPVLEVLAQFQMMHGSPAHRLSREAFEDSLLRVLIKARAREELPDPSELSAFERLALAQKLSGRDARRRRLEPLDRERGPE